MRYDIYTNGDLFARETDFGNACEAYMIAYENCDSVSMITVAESPADEADCLTLGMDYTVEFDLGEPA